MHWRATGLTKLDIIVFRFPKFCQFDKMSMTYPV